MLSRFYWEMFQRAMDSAIASMSTSALALLSGLAYGIYKLILSYRKEGWKGVREHFGKDVAHGLIFGLCWWTLLLAYHLFVKVPRGIAVEADNSVAPSARHPVPPPSAYLYTPRRKQGNARNQEPRLHWDETDPFREYNNDQFIELGKSRIKGVQDLFDKWFQNKEVMPTEAGVGAVQIAATAPIVNSS